MGNVGGDPGQMSGGAASLHRSGSALTQMHSALSGAGGSVAGAAGEPELTAALQRFFAAWSAMIGDTGTQLSAAAQLAANAAADLHAVGGD